MRHPFLLLIMVFSVLLSGTAIAQEMKIEFEPASLELEVNGEATVSAKLVDGDGNVVSDSLLFFSSSRRSLAVSRDGNVKALMPGSFRIIALYIPSEEGGDRVRASMPVEVAFPPVTSVSITNMPDNIYQHTTLELNALVKDGMGMTRENVDVVISSSNEDVVSVDDFLNLKAKKPGSFRLTVQAENVTETISGRVSPNPTASLEMTHNYGDKEIRTGDVVHFDAKALNNAGDAIEDMPISYSYIAQPEDNLGQGASAQMEQDGRFVASATGTYTIISKSGQHSTRSTLRVVPRNVERPISVVGKGIVDHAHTSDLWVWEGVDGRDYAVTGTWGGNGEAIFWDVTDPTTITPIDTVTVDARTVNDVKVSEDGRVAVITREGASDRKNGIVILDVSNPRDVTILSEYTDGLTGGVHNSFIYEDHVYAVNNGTKYDIINIEDPKNPYRVNIFELDTPGHAIHDVWIQDGIAYSSNWSDGVVAVDIGSNESADLPGAGGSPENPVKLGSYTYPSGWNHAAFPFKSESTGDFYIVAGDEAFPYGLNLTGANRAAGWLHFVKFNDWNSPEEVARYQVPEAGSHNYWIEGDVLYAAFYNGGLRVVDISGELMGNLYDQGREIATFFPTDEEAYVPNASFTWGPQPYKGYIFLSDWNSGIWALKLGESTASGTN